MYVPAWPPWEESVDSLLRETEPYGARVPGDRGGVERGLLDGTESPGTS